MTWIIAGYAIGACIMAGMVAHIILSGQEQLDGWVGFFCIVGMSALWPVTVAALVVGASLDWRDRHRRLARRRRRPPLAYRWSDNDRYWWRFTYANENRPDGRGRNERRIFGLYLSSKGEEDDGAFCLLRAHLLGRTLILRLPRLFGTAREWVDTSRYGWSTNPNGGYWDIHERSYGFLFVMGALHVDYGAQTHDSTTDKTWIWSLPWKGWRHVRFSIYGLEGEHIWSQFDRDRPLLGRIDRPDSCSWWDRQRTAEDAAPVARFEFLDFDKERLTATTQIHEREWHRGEGRFRWLSWFWPARIERSLSIKFSGETGRRKGSWKGGTIGHSIGMMPGELHQAAFARYAAEHDMTYPPPPRPERVDGVPLPCFGTDGVGVRPATGFGDLDAAAKRIEEENG